MWPFIFGFVPVRAVFGQAGVNPSGLLQHKPTHQFENTNTQGGKEAVV